MSTISASTLITTALQYTADTTGTLVFKTGATPTTALTLNADQSATFAGTVNFATAGFTNLSYTGTFTGGTGVIAIGTSQIYKDASGNVGIGTASPVSNTEISASANCILTITTPNDTTPGIDFRSNSVDRLAIYSSSNYGANFNVRSNQEMRFGTNNTQRMTITAAGNVGIGNTGPVSILEVTKAGVANMVIGYNNTSENYYDANTQIFRNASSSSEYMRIDSSGNVGIGTSSPSSFGKLAVNTAALGSAQADGINLAVNGTLRGALIGTGTTYSYAGTAANSLWLYSASNPLYLGPDGATYVAVVTNGSERLRLDSGGSVLPGADGGQSFGSASKRWLSVNAITFSEGGAANNFITTSGTTTLFNSGSTWTSAAFYTSGTEKMRITSGGDVAIGTSTIYNNAKLNVVGGNGIYCNNSIGLTTTLQGIYSGTGGMLVLRDNTNGGACLILYENAEVIIVSQSSGSHFTTGTPSGVQIQLTGTNVTTGSYGMSAKIGTGTTDLNVGIFSVDYN